jgi:HK97 family phage portal protein
MRNPFSRMFARAVSVPALQALGMDDVDDLRSLCDLHATLDARIEAAMLKQMDPTTAADINSYGSDDGAGFFGREFEIRTTAGRLKSLYGREPWIYAGSTLVARTLATVPFFAYDKRTGAKVPNHALELLFKAGGPIESGIAAQWASDLDLDLTGNSFLVVDNSLKGYMHVPAELCTIKLADPAKDGRIGLQSITILDPRDAKGTRMDVDYKHVIHIRMPNPSNKFYGMPAWVAAARPILLDRYKNEYDMAFYLRGATHTGVIETTEEMTKSRLARLMTTFEAAFTGRRNWWRPLFLPKGAKWVSSSPTMVEMQHLEGLRENRKVILAVRGIPGAMVGLVDDANRANMEAQQRQFWENTIVPMAQFKAACWNGSYIAKTVYPAVELRPDFSGIEAMQGSLISKGEQAKAVENHWKLDEIRSKIYGMPPMGDERGNKLVVELRASATPPGATGSTTPLMDAVAGGQNPSALPPGSTTPAALPPATPDATTPPPPAQGDGKRMVDLRAKDEATASQNRIEDKLSTDLDNAYASFIDATLKQAANAVADRRDVGVVLAASEQHRVAGYWQAAQSPMRKALDRSFSASQANVRCPVGVVATKRMAYEFTEADRQAIEVLRERTADGQRRLLADRAITRFAGHSARVTEQIMRIVEHGQEQGESWSEIARTIRDRYTEAYPNQANTIVRTELLSAVSQGFKWNQDALQTVFSVVEKQWLHQGDVGTNPNAREWHADFEDLGVVEAEHEYAPGLAYPRDPRAEAGEVVNCRCSQVSVIPADATSNANAILDTEF